MDDCAIKLENPNRLLLAVVFDNDDADGVEDVEVDGGGEAGGADGLVVKPAFRLGYIKIWFFHLDSMFFFYYL